MPLTSGPSPDDFGTLIPPEGPLYRVRGKRTFLRGKGLVGECWPVGFGRARLCSAKPRISLPRRHGAGGAHLDAPELLVAIEDLGRPLRVGRLFELYLV